mgnify:CR=1 FL=1
MVTLGSLEGGKGNFVDGPFGSNLKSSEYTQNGVPLIQLKNIKPNKYITKDLKYVSQEKADSISRHSYKAGDVCISKLGAVGTACIIPVGAPDGIIVADVVRFRGDKSKIDYNYFCHYLNSPIGQRRVLQLSRGSTRVRTNLTDLKKVEIPLPYPDDPEKSLKEQKRIAAILDKADGIRRKRQQAIQLADDFLRSVFLDMFGDPVTNPKGWEVKALKDISRIQIGPFGTQLHKKDYIQGGIPLINPTHIVKGQIVPKSDLTITLDKHASLSEYHLDIGDVIMGRRGEMGRCAVISDKEKSWLCGTGSLFIRPKKRGVFSEYLNKLLSSDAIKNHLNSESQGATMPNLNKTIVGNIQVPVPSDEALHEFSILKKKILKSKSMYSDFSKESVFESLSQKAFKGEL